MGVLTNSWCFCNGGGKSEKMKAAIFSGKGPAMATISSSSETTSGTGFLIHRNLLLTTHVNLPSISAAETTEIRLQNGVRAVLFPHRFFITSSVLDLTIVGLDNIEGDQLSSLQGQNHLHYLKTTCSKPNLDLGNLVYLLGYTHKKELTVGEGKVVIATDNLIKLLTDDQTWNPGSAGFDQQGNLAFMVCDPMKLATSPNAKSPSTSTSSSSSSRRKDRRMQFGIPIPIICDWLNQHWEGNLDELNKPKLPIIKLMSSGQRSDHSCASFTMRRVFKPSDIENDPKQTDPNPVGPGIVEKTMDDLDAAEVLSTDSVKGAAAGESEAQSSSSPVEMQNDYNYSSDGETTMYSAETAESRNIPSPKEGRFQQVVRQSQSCRWGGGGSGQRTPVARKVGLEKQRSYIQGRKIHSQGATSNRSNDYYSPTVSSIMKKRNNMVFRQQQPEQKQSWPVKQNPAHSSPRWMF
ncbi:uncharacterized protein LOC124935879 [Impatiens glandulifera]|uniref:uncharacterized protein LOC124935879 n=1 Tax=Impatiens glandulifera TaxID=253017 RepID=UPI001FB132FF|nr:uncharacterized protein LOC124935879 [Impatiens glandulifera]